MRIKIQYVLMALIVLVVFAAGIYVYPQLPEQVPTHWGPSGEPDGWGGRWGAAFGFPIGLLVGIPSMLFLPRIDPRWNNIKNSQDTYLWFMVAFTLFMGSMQIFTLFWGLGYTPSMNRFIGIAIGLLFCSIGWMMTRFEQNYTIGFRTSWALADERVWAPTQRFGAIGFFISGVLAVISGVFFENLVMWFILAPVLFVTFGGMAYSYWLYRRLPRK